MTDGNMPRSNVKDHFRNEEWIITRRSVTFCKLHYFFLESDQSADTAGKYDADTVGVHFFFIYTCIPYGLVAGRQRDLRITINLTGLLFIQVLQGVKAFQFTSKASFEL